MSSSRKVDDETILDVLRASETPALTTTEVAGKLPITRGSTRSRLQALVDDDHLERDREGRNVIWWVPERREEVEEWRAGEPEIEPTAQAKAETEDGPIEVDVEAEAAAADESEPEVETPDEETETRTGVERPELSDDDEGLRALALVAVAAVGYLLFRKLRS
ncbi:hypothetical protein [Natronomonas sp. EA1]|uniref:hypothetical protein n=1 Tax=Natronomonas sp. EA1 TaxID=3421655 RepID=UPI003EB80005